MKSFGALLESQRLTQIGASLEAESFASERSWRIEMDGFRVNEVSRCRVGGMMQKQTQKLNRRGLCVPRHVQHRAFLMQLPRRGSRDSGHAADLSQYSFNENSTAISLMPLPRQDSRDSKHAANLSQYPSGEANSLVLLPRQDSRDSGHAADLHLARTAPRFAVRVPLRGSCESEYAANLKPPSIW